MNYPSVCKEESKIFLMQSLLLMWQIIECSNKRLMVGNNSLKKVTLFCNKQGVQILAMEDNYMPYGKSACYARNRTNDDHFKREIYIGVIDQIS